MTYKQILDYIYSIPMFQNVGQAAYNPSLDKTIALCEFLGNPQNKFKTIHIAGTNGKGSSSNMLNSILRDAGYKVGLYTSPHLIDYRERVVINSEMISEDLVVEFMSVAYDKIRELQPSFFEITTILAFWAFAHERVDVAVIETGLGGRIDSTNVINPLLSLITNIGIDHKNILGDTIEQIAKEKAGIIKNNTPVVISEYNPITAEVFRNTAHEKHSDLYFAKDFYTILADDIVCGKRHITIRSQHSQEYVFDLKMLGEYQTKNLLGVIKVAELLSSEFGLTSQNITNGVNSTEVVGRWQTLQNSPRLICDVGHNYDGVSEVVKMLEQTLHNQLYIVLGFMADKDINEIVNLLPKSAQYICTQANNERAMKCEELSYKLQSLGFQVSCEQEISKAVARALSLCSSDDLVFLGGSCFVVADYLAYLQNNRI